MRAFPCASRPDGSGYLTRTMYGSSERTPPVSRIPLKLTAVGFPSLSGTAGAAKLFVPLELKTIPFSVSTATPSRLTTSSVTSAVTYEVVNRLGVAVDTEKGIVFSSSGTNSFAAPAVPLREGKPTAVSFNGILETGGVRSDEPYIVRVRYPDPSGREAQGNARIYCSPTLLP